ncbi:MAG: DUF2520 domain-containing protein [Bacteroidales bacterium]|nr:DUF2520 domain-containing protein [Bacteroidota bacterium]MBL6950811.1 DUF2520 domain-containing protein [Bacteroidales bacterium]
MNPIRNIIVLGAGNVATHLTRALVSKGFSITQLYNPSEERGRTLASKVKAGYIGSPENLDRSADLYILAVSDDAIATLASRLHVDSGIVVHTSGSKGMDILQPFFSHSGVFYPLQTFMQEREISFNSIPICIEASDRTDENSLLDFAGQLSSCVHLINSDQRRILHMTAVFAGNFSNFMYSIAEDLLEKHNIPFDLLKPLIRQTAENIEHADLFSLQTGPAVRQDSEIMEEHRALLTDHDLYKKIYDLISISIIQQKNKHDKL